MPNRCLKRFLSVTRVAPQVDSRRKVSYFGLESRSGMCLPLQPESSTATHSCELIRPLFGFVTTSFSVKCKCGVLCGRFSDPTGSEAKFLALERNGRMDGMMVLKPAPEIPKKTSRIKVASLNSTNDALHRTLQPCDLRHRKVGLLNLTNDYLKTLKYRAVRYHYPNVSLTLP